VPRRDRALWALAVILSIALLMAPALWNGFVLLQWDTGGYLARWYEGYLVPSRAVVYGLILNAGAFAPTRMPSPTTPTSGSGAVRCSTGLAVSPASTTKWQRSRSAA
jgi:hypothetical protein